jgi:hypothetical protein
MLARPIAQALVSVFLLLAASCEGEDPGQLTGGISVEGERCGGWGAGSCAQGLYCEYPDLACVEVDGVGTCKAAPRRCDRDAPSVCSCAGQRYDSVCEAVAAGLDAIVAGEGCGPGLDAEARQSGGTVDPPDPA